MTTPTDQESGMALGPIPPLSDERPWAQGFNDWLAFGRAADAFKKGEAGFEEYERGKSDAHRRFYNGSPKERSL